ncbi:hypothetical protein A2641_00240 [Candidatus Nomurabacteria bacterium RIFCSPHIGHO2_01_FULL_37_25]|uniref:Uncharacterized protein n=1 Tax=Candidatus Nomurabacteria bacterium RIFCSPLOWO2_01_FULL_36_16 TaxID=1801767 RepID=A0A1F6WYF5_9BACT|nr:MAG: hypothetical protein A2641_00240 [Candidatus Nomurabacteria bacterium RIFCSPHIGHO2_01_FULL_37_25]OGI75275.1 MAG: hypothetical protein A3D36_04020 [Candidatus Nomurabacteria bacterium RIFCSPHIGHO2_02_FULL_36_29]OGI86902.1 MAG: hypothetical protein A3A91_03480 [Candidatus Nomurabacteria bacterium RIFCSPLOWO2_01_FULL_36_16]OGI96831.1 MAG: hypothetical protein A3I84_02105 [Candidatus Nomurabacteria bacterium RIFCSPLOWO2_02_FULL_36_8]
MGKLVLLVLLVCLLPLKWGIFLIISCPVAYFAHRWTGKKQAEIDKKISAAEERRKQEEEEADLLVPTKEAEKEK